MFIDVVCFPCVLVCFIYLNEFEIDFNSFDDLHTCSYRVLRFHYRLRSVIYIYIYIYIRLCWRHEPSRNRNCSILVVRRQSYSTWCILNSYSHVCRWPSRFTQFVCNRIASLTSFFHYLGRASCIGRKTMEMDMASSTGVTTENQHSYAIQRKSIMIILQFPIGID